MRAKASSRRAQRKSWRRNNRRRSRHVPGEATMGGAMRTDAELLRASRDDPAAFRELYDRYAEQMHAFHVRRTRDTEAALDLTAETFAQAWLHRRRFRDRAGGLAGPWLYGIARN